MAGYVYLVGSTNFGWYKIGKSARPETRVKELGILLPFKVEVVGIWKAQNHHIAEKALHEKFSAFRLNGEWFRLDRKQIEALRAELVTSEVTGLLGFSNAPPSAHELKAERKQKCRERYNQMFSVFLKAQDIDDNLENRQIFRKAFGKVYRAEIRNLTKLKK